MQGITGGVEIAGQQHLWHAARFLKPAPMYELAGSYTREPSFPTGSQDGIALEIGSALDKVNPRLG